jgi:hypothetical protein
VLEFLLQLIFIYERWDFICCWNSNQIRQYWEEMAWFWFLGFLSKIGCEKNQENENGHNPEFNHITLTIFCVLQWDILRCTYSSNFFLLWYYIFAVFFGKPQKTQYCIYFLGNRAVHWGGGIKLFSCYFEERKLYNRL